MSSPIKSEIVVPFLKWAGGKRWLISNHSHLFPETFNTYVEPFLGSGAVFFHLKPEVSILSDLNAELINTYKSIKDDWEPISNQLIKYQKLHSKDYYYEIRGRKFRKPQTRAAQFIYLNRTCWNGLYRVNLKGQFNVPIGTKQNVILGADNFEKVSKLLKNSTFIAGDFEETIKLAKKDDFLFIDPPYTVKHNLNGFVKYNNQLFSWEDQVRLKDSIEEAVNRGAKVLVTNADHGTIRDLYSGIGELLKLNRKSVIASNADARGTYSELVIKCY